VASRASLVFLSRSSACSPCFKAGFIISYASSLALGFSRMREFSSASCHLLPHLTNVFFFFSPVTSRYDIFAINLASIMLGYVYGHTAGTCLTRNALVF
jgi:hypothetical protein